MLYAGFGLFEKPTRLLLLHQTFAHQIANGFLRVDVEQRNNKTIDVGRIEFGLGTASLMVLCLKLTDDGLEDIRSLSANFGAELDAFFQIDLVCLVAVLLHQLVDP